MHDRRTLRYWPWLAMCAAGAVVFGGLVALTGSWALRTGSAVFLVVSAGLALGFLVLAGYTLASLRVRTVVDPTGATAVWPFSRERVEWAQVERLDVTHLLPGWVVRGWLTNRAVVLFICHDTHGRRPRRWETFETPPVTAPRPLQQAYAEIDRCWRSARGLPVRY
ncbi:MAG TPA: hypothetical protein VFM55_09550 [Micromonosporaceae bacterium]|nr:hypothetical protein [Micromonosporaceae bacterium]